jgi:hypothetical protein
LNAGAGGVTVGDGGAAGATIDLGSAHAACIDAIAATMATPITRTRRLDEVDVI